MRKKPKPKRLGVKDLLQLIGANPNDVVPTSISEARLLAGVTHEEQVRCPSNGKVCFSSESGAKSAARARLNKGSNVGKLRTYRCPDCNQFHLSSSFHR